MLHTIICSWYTKCFLIVKKAEAPQIIGTQSENVCTSILILCVDCQKCKFLKLEHHACVHACMVGRQTSRQADRHQSTTNPFAYKIETDQQFLHNLLITKNAQHIKLGRCTMGAFFIRKQRTENNYQLTTKNRTAAIIFQEESFLPNQLGKE